MSFLRINRFLFISTTARRRAMSSGRNILKLNKRGIINDFFPKEDIHDFPAFLERSPRCIYSGFDPTAASLHVGNLLVLTTLLRCQNAGHNVIALIGGATARIGDPSGKSKERPLLDYETISRYSEGIRDNIQTIFNNHEKYFNSSTSPGSLKIVNNYDWYKDMNVLELFSSVGRHCRIGRMLTRHSVKTRLESEVGLNFTEFAYQVFQAYDWVYLYDKFNCEIQLGGSDQMGNIHSGQDVLHRMRDKIVFGITVPIVKSVTGKKLGKTEENAVWLSSSMTSAFDFYQYFYRMPDTEVEQMLRYFSFMPLKEIEDLMTRHWNDPGKWEAQERLATDLTLLVHGEKGLSLALKTKKILYESDTETLAQINDVEMRNIFPQSGFIRLLFSPGMSILDFAMKIRCFRTEKDAIRIIHAGGFYINQVRKDNIEEILLPNAHIMPNNLTLVRIGKRNYYIVEWTL